jgi:hypothetical protein
MFDSFVEYLKERSNKNIFGPQKVNRIWKNLAFFVNK